jgi:hypothetical protein
LPVDWWCVAHGYNIHHNPPHVKKVFTVYRICDF